MKILYHHRTASADGQAVHIEELIAALREQGHEVRVVAPVLNGNSATTEQGLDWVGRLKAHLPKPLYEVMELAYSWVAYRRLAHEYHSFKPDLLYERYNLHMIAGALLAKRYKLPLFLEVNAPLVHERSLHGGLALRWLASWSEGFAWRAADYVLPVTQILAGFVKDYGVPESKIAVIPNGINEAHFSNTPTPEQAKAALGLEGRLVLGFTGYVRDWHGVDKVVRWMADERSPATAHLLVVGDGPAREELERLAQELGVSERVTFTGVVARKDVPSHVAAFDIALQPAVVAYASPLKLFEYLFLGKAVLAPDAPNLREVLEDAHNALLFSPDQPGSLEAALLRLCEDAQLRADLGKHAHQSIAERQFTWQCNARKVEALGYTLLSRKKVQA
jgi:glycosyltransferase involved in cell wall biosynthesis